MELFGLLESTAVWAITALGVMLYWVSFSGSGRHTANGQIAIQSSISVSL